MPSLKEKSLLYSLQTNCFFYSLILIIVPMCGDYKSCAWKIGDPPAAEVDDELDYYLNQALAVPPDPIGEIQLYPTTSFPVGLISLGDPVLKSNVPQQPKPVVGLEYPQYESKTVVALGDINFDDLFSDDCTRPQEEKAEQKLQSPPRDYYCTVNMENKDKRQQCLGNVEINNKVKKKKVEKKDEKQYYFINSIGDGEIENCFNFINNNRLEGIESNVLLTKKKRRSKRGLNSKQQKHWLWNFGSEDDQNKPLDYMTTKRMCSHCKADKTPQWRVGPWGPKTLCNACGVRYKSGRLLPEYRPASSPTFDTVRHSNFHRKIIKRREGLILPIAS